MCEESFPSFTAFTVPPKTLVTVEIPEGSVWTVTGASIDFANEIPKEGRTVLYISAITGEKGTEKTAIAPLTVGKNETATLYLELRSLHKYRFTTEGSDIPVTVRGDSSVPTPLVVTTVPK